MGKLRLTRRVNQAVVITVAGVQVRVIVSDVDPRGSVGLVFDAPGEVQVNREEIQAKIDAIAAGRLHDAKTQ